MAAERGGNAGKEPERQVISAAILYFLARKTYFPAGNGYFSAGKYTQYRTGQYSRAENRTVEDSTVQQRTAEQRSAASALVTELEELMDCKFDRNFCLELTRLSKAGMQREVFLDAVHKTGERRPRNPAAYFRTILQGYERDGVLTSADLAATAAKPEPAPVAPPGGTAARGLGTGVACAEGGDQKETPGSNRTRGRSGLRRRKHNGKNSCNFTVCMLK